MLSLCESEVLQEYINKPRSQMTEEEKKRIKYASIRKREQMRKAAATFKAQKMFDSKNPAVEREYKKFLQQQKKEYQKFIHQQKQQIQKSKPAAGKK